LQLNEDLCEVIALAHDLGHTPFGHSGERTLNELMEDFGGFEHNVQSYRIVTELEKKYPSFPGLNLSYEVRQGLLKHKSKNDNIPSATFKSIEAQTVNLADEIAYNNHDIDDGLLSGILVEEELCQNVTLYKEAKQEAMSRYTNLSVKEHQHLTNSILISWFINDLVATTRTHIQSLGISTLNDVQEISGPIAKYSDELREKNLELRRFLFTRFYQHPDVYKMNKKGQMIIQKLFELFTSDTKTLPLNQQEKIQNGSRKERVVSDYIAGMTDTFAAREFDTLFN
jgi:dGTPase